jgi:hypothetical protein
MHVAAECRQQHRGGMRQQGNGNRCQSTAGMRGHQWMAPLALS